MRLWHQKLIPLLPRQQLLGLHREVCALRGKGWGRKHSTVDYVFEYDIERLVAYHYLVIDEMERRGYKVDFLWKSVIYRGKHIGNDFSIRALNVYEQVGFSYSCPIYSEHNKEYLLECLNNLKSKGVMINV